MRYALVLPYARRSVEFHILWSGQARLLGCLRHRCGPAETTDTGDTFCVGYYFL